jgi:uncharacterized protein CbrC (UPF0167 family)
MTPGMSEPPFFHAEVRPGPDAESARIASEAGAMYEAEHHPKPLTALQRATAFCSKNSVDPWECKPEELAALLEAIAAFGLPASVAGELDAVVRSFGTTFEDDEVRRNFMLKLGEVVMHDVLARTHGRTVVQQQLVEAQKREAEVLRGQVTADSRRIEELNTEVARLRKLVTPSIIWSSDSGDLCLLQGPDGLHFTYENDESEDVLVPVSEKCRQQLLVALSPPSGPGVMGGVR